MFPIRHLLGAMCCAGLVFDVACTRSTPAPANNAAERANSLTGSAAECNVLLITMDTTRADFLGCYGRPGNVSPVLDELARSGVRFENAFTHAPVTLVAHTSLMTGALPPEHGVRSNGRFALGPELPTLAEIYRQHGYRTAAFVAASVLAARHGLNRGFEVYNDAPPPWVTEGKQRGRRAFSCSADVMCQRALAELNALRNERFFCWVHFFDPHGPYEPPQQYAEQADGNFYGGEIAFMDANIGRLLRWLEDNHLRERTLIVALADHGEGLHDHGYLWHALLVYREMMHIPLIMSLPGRLPQNRVINDLVATSDIMPTLLELSGWPVPPTVSGASLATVLAGHSMAPRAIYGETQYPLYSFGWSPLYALTTTDWAYIRAPRPELYSRSADPKQQENLAAARPELLAQLEEQLQVLEAGLRPHCAPVIKSDSAQQRALRSLGYAGDTPGPGHSTDKLKNPRDMVMVEFEYRAAQMLAPRFPEEAAERLEALVEQSPESYQIVLLLGNCLRAAGRLEESQLMLTKALELFPESDDAAVELARTVAARGRLGHAVKICQQVLKREPEQGRAQWMLTGLLKDHGTQQLAIADGEADCRADGDGTNSEAVLNLGDLLVADGRETEAVSLLQEAYEKSPNDAPVCARLAWYRATLSDLKLRDGAAALALAEEALAKGEPDPRSAAALAAAYAELGRFEEAAHTARQIKHDFGSDARVPGNLQYQMKLYKSGRPFRELP